MFAEGKDYEDISRTRELLHNKQHAQQCAPTRIIFCLQRRLWDSEVVNPHTDETLPPVTFHDFIHKGAPRGLGSTYDEVESIIRDNPEAVALWESASGRKVAPLKEDSEKAVRLNIEDIRLDGGTQARVKLDEATVQRYIEYYADDAPSELPAVVVFWDSETLWLADGFHRVEAAKRAGRNRIRAVKHEGSHSDAVLHAVQANRKHGLPTTPADRKRAVQLLLRDEQWVRRSDPWIAEQCGVTDKSATKYRIELEATSEIPRLDTRVGRDGRERASQPKKPAEPVVSVSATTDPPPVPPTVAKSATVAPSEPPKAQRPDESRGDEPTGDSPVPAPSVARPPLEHEAAPVHQLTLDGGEDAVPARDELLECAVTAYSVLSAAQREVFWKRVAPHEGHPLLPGEVPHVANR